jgi:hypothetical protein
MAVKDLELERIATQELLTETPETPASFSSDQFQSMQDGLTKTETQLINAWLISKPYKRW